MPHFTRKGHCQTCAIRPQSIFSDLTDRQLEDIKDFHTNVYTYEAGDMIYMEGDKANYAYTLRKGMVKLTKGLPDGRNQIVRLLKDGDLFGFDGFAQSTYNQSAYALIDIEVCQLPLAQLSELRRNYPEIDKTMTARWLSHLTQAENMMVELGAKKAPEKLASFLFRWCQGKQPGEWVELPLTRSEIGDLLGLTIETISRFISDWKRNGFITEHKNTIRIVDASAFKEYACKSGGC